MATLTINIPDSQVPRIIEALVRTQNPDADDSELTASNAKGVLIDHIKRYVRRYETAKAAAQEPESTDPDLS